MKNRLSKYFLILMLLLSLTLLAQPGSLSYGKNDEPKRNPESRNLEAKKLDEKAFILQKYLEKYNSPLAYHSQDFIDASIAYGVDWKLVPAISGVESTFGQFSSGYNAWGWGIYGDQAIYFQNWRDGIFTVTAGLKENYINKGLLDPYSMNRIYAQSPSWGVRVNYFMKDLEKFDQNYSPSESLVKQKGAEDKIYASSAKLASNLAE